jgi:y4mF family transcriptional regulator
VGKKLADIIRFHRKLSGLTQLELAEMADVGKNLIYEVEKGKLGIRLDNLLKILQVLNIELNFHSPLYERFLKEHPDNADCL